MIRPRPRVRRDRSGRLVIDLRDQERDLIASLLPQMRQLLLTSDPSLERVFPPGYADDPEREAEYQELVHDDLLERRLAAIDLVEETLTDTDIDEDKLTAWMGAVNDIRLVLGTRLDITEDFDEEIDLDNENAGAYVVYQYLTVLLGDIVDALAGW